MKGIERILCVIVSEKDCRPALERAVMLAENNQSSLTVVKMVESLAGALKLLKNKAASADLQTRLAHYYEQQIASLVEPYRKRIPIRTLVLEGIVFLEIIREVLRNKHDLVVKMTDTTDWLGQLFSSDDMHLLRKCPCPVWLVKPNAPKTCRRILAAVDVSNDCTASELMTRQELNQRILQAAISLALSEFGRLHIVHVWDAIGENLLRTRRALFMNATYDEITQYIEQVKIQHQKNLNFLMHEMTDRLGKSTMDYLRPQLHLIKGSARKEVPVLSKQLEADLIIMGTVARTGIPGFIMGNTAEAILNHINCSVLAIKPPGFDTPVKLEN